ncbi:MAG: glycosyltransferase family 2 protein [Selenomonadaceae bacterium]|nr:glycosyltransferase family 2 protein [Selenomonadaceae bacterium]
MPLYNVEKYVGECLDSILAQTLQDFEVIVVDDCSTDSSVAVVESYMSKFDGRLKLTRMKKNSGGAGLPRNKGIEFSCGEYLAFVDPDDTITPTAFEELYTLAKNFDADVVHCEKWYQLPDEFYNDAEYRKTLTPYS